MKRLLMLLPKAFEAPDQTRHLLDFSGREHYGSGACRI